MRDHDLLEQCCGPVVPQEPCSTPAVALLEPLLANRGGVHGGAHAQARWGPLGQDLELHFVPV